MPPDSLHFRQPRCIDWISNTKDRQKRYVASRIARILKTSSVSDWKHIPTAWSSADVGTRPISVSRLRESMWLRGPEFLGQPVVEIPMTPVSNTNLSPPGVPPAPAKFFRKNARHATEDITMGKRWKRELERVLVENSLPNRRSASMVLEKQMQKETWPHGMESIRKLPKREYASLLVTDSPFLDEDGLIKGGGRLAHADLSFGRKHATLIPDSE